MRPGYRKEAAEPAHVAPVKDSAAIDIDAKVREFVAELGAQLSSGTLELPSFPDTALRVRRALEDPNADVEKIARVVNSEPVLAGRMLRIANSALLNAGGQQVTDLHRAISRLGQDMVRNAAMSLATEQLFQARGMGRLKPHLQVLWRHSIRTAALAYVIAKKLSRVNPDEALLAGLLHDIGKLYILTRADSHPELFADQATLDEVMVAWHTGIGKAILDAWELPEEIGIAADEHESLDRDHIGPADLADVVLVANLHAHLGNKASRYRDVGWGTVPAVSKLNLKPQLSMDCLRESAQEIDSLAGALSG